MRRNPANIRFIDVVAVCTHYFGEPRQSGSSHVVFAMPWPGDPRVNLQNDKGMAKTYQVRQALKAIDRRREDQR
ncbi:MAG: toxin HicA [Solirubrobacteraceae bacterium]